MAQIWTLWNYCIGWLRSRFELEDSVWNVSDLNYNQNLDSKQASTSKVEHDPMVQALLGKKEGLTNYEFLVQRAITYFGMGKKMKDESLEKVMGDENM